MTAKTSSLINVVFQWVVYSSYTGLVVHAFLAVVGCSKVDPGKNPEMTEITGTVTLKGQPVSDVILNLQPTGTGTMATIPVAQGKFKASVTPGKYTYFISETSRGAAVLAKIPKQYHAGALDRQIDIAAGTVLDIKLD